MLTAVPEMLTARPGAKGARTRNWSLRWAALATFVVLVSICTSGCGTNESGANAVVGVVQPGTSLFGYSYSELTGEWWEWAASSPLATNPVADPTGQFAAINQTGPIFFLAGTFGGVARRTISLPLGRGVFFPLISSVAWAPEDGGTVPALRADAAVRPNGVDILLCEIDGVPLFDLFSYRAGSPVFALDIPIGSIFTEPAFGGFAAGVRSPAVADGYWVLLNPLSPGPHTIHLRGRVNGGAFETEVFYDILVQ